MRQHPRWLELSEVEEKIRQALRVPRHQRLEIKHANFAKINNQKFYVSGGGLDLIASFFADPQTARKESLILDYLNEVERQPLDIGLVAPEKRYHRQGLLIRERLAGRVMSARQVSNETLQKIAGLLLLFQRTPVPKPLKEYPLSYAKMRDGVRSQIGPAREAFAPFRGSREAFDRGQEIWARDWSKSLRRQPKGFVHGDVQPQNILLQNGKKIALIDFDRGGYFYPLFDAASFAVQFTHASLLEQYHQSQPDRREIHRRREVFLKEYRTGIRQLGAVWDEELFRLFKLLILFDGMAFSTAGFRKKVTRGHKHLLFGLFRQELKQLI